MTSWRATASDAAQGDLDALLGAVLPFAEETLGKYGGLYPFGAGVRADGQIAMLAADPGLGDDPPSGAVLDALYAGAGAQADDWRAMAFVADVDAGGTDAIRLELEHREGVALLLLVPYARDVAAGRVRLGDITTGGGRHHVWAG